MLLGWGPEKSRRRDFSARGRLFRRYTLKKKKTTTANFEREREKENNILQKSTIAYIMIFFILF